MPNTATARVSPSGPKADRKGLLAIPLTAVATTAGATCTATFDGCEVNDVVTVSPRAVLTGAAVAVAFAFVVTTNLICVGFNNPGASTNQAASTFDCVVQRR